MNYLKELATTYVEQLEWWVLAVLTVLILMMILGGTGAFSAVGIAFVCYTGGWLVGYIILRPILLRMAEKERTGE